MSGLTAALGPELLKARRSRVPMVTAIGFSLAPLVGGLFMAILKDPSLAERFGLVATKAMLSGGGADWMTYIGLLAQAVAVGGVILYGLVAIWVFGREYSDRTITDLLALPTSRTSIVAAKFVVVFGWSIALATLVALIGLAVGMVVGLSGWSSAVALDGAVRVSVAALLTLAVVTPFAAAASIGRGYLAAVAVIFLVLVLSQVIAALGWGAFFPWSVPALYSGAAGTAVPQPSAVSYVLVALTSAAGIAATIAWWTSADQT